jgi:hypothetical protein
LRGHGRLALAGASIAMLGATPAALADGTETLGAPGIPLGAGQDVLVAGVGTQEQAGTPVELSFQVPADASVKQVLVYWNGQYTWPGHGSFDGGDAEIEIEGEAVEGTLIGGPSNPFLREQFETYRADVTALGLVSSGTNAITVSGMNFQTDLFGPSGNKGVGIAVLFDDGTPSTRAGYVDGQDYVYSGFPEPFRSTAPQTFTFAAKPADRAATLSMLVGEAVERNPPGVQGNVINGTFDSGQTFTLVNSLASKQGFEFDAENLPVTIPAGAKSLTVDIVSEGGDGPGSLQWLQSSLTVEGGETPPPVDECKPYSHKWFVWVAWWKKYLTHKFGRSYANRYETYFERVYKPCAPKPDPCKTTPRTLSELLRYHAAGCHRRN